MSDPIVTESLTRLYSGRAVVDDLTLKVLANTVFGFLGPNGAGKSTTIKLLTGQIKPTRGKAWVAGFDISRQALQSHRQIGYLGEMPNFYSWMRGHELLEFVGEIFGLNPAERRARAKELLRLVGLEEAARRKVGAYSGGMRQRLGIAQALVGRPQVLFLDEPVSALDPLGRRDVLALLEKIREEATVFMSSHVLTDVDRVCEQIAILNQGKLVLSGATTEIKEKYASPLIEIQLEGGQDAVRQLATALAAYPQIRRLTPQENGRLQVELISEAATREAGQFIPARLAALNLTLLGFQAVLPDLEEIFVRLVGAENKSATAPNATGEAVSAK